MYTIYVESLTCEAVIGILPHERKMVQRVVAECEIGYLRERDSFIDYAEVSRVIVSMLQEGKYGLVEDALEEITAALKKAFPTIKSLRLKLCKPDILSNCRVCVEKAIKY